MAVGVLTLSDGTLMLSVGESYVNNPRDLLIVIGHKMLIHTQRRATMAVERAKDGLR